MDKKTIGLILALLAAVGALVSLYFTQSKREPKISLGPYQALGQRAAEETSTLLDKKGALVVILNDPGDTADPVMDAQMESFKVTLKQHGSLTIAATETVKMDAMTSMGTGGAIPRDQFLAILKRHPQASAFVLFIGFPPLAESDLAALKQNPAKFIAVTAYLPGYKRLLESRVIHLAIVPRFDAVPETAAKPQTLSAWFDQEYVVLTPERTVGLPY